MSISKKKYTKKRKSILRQFPSLAFIIIGFFIGYKVSPNKESLASNIVLSESASDIKIRFSPKGNCCQLIEQTIEKAKNKILVQAYYFTSKELADAIIKAKKKGVIVKMLVDKSQKKVKYSQIRNFLANDIIVMIDKVSGIAHNKIMIIDDSCVVTGSYNWTASAELRNSENILVINNKKVAEIYTENWNKRFKNAKPI